MSKSISPNTIIGHYCVVSKIGEGGMGEVYLAEDSRLLRKAALKILPSEMAANQDRMRRFKQEAKAASALNHPNIITIHEIDQTETVYFIAAEFIDGETLRQQMKVAPMKLGQVLDVAGQVASALSVAHAAGIIHRDIKPENIMLRRDGLVKVLDFGLAKLSEPQPVGVATGSIGSEAETRMEVKTEPGVVMGTAIYMSPEQARGILVDARTDIFSFGVLIYELIAGRLPFDGSHTNEILASILSDKEPAPMARYAREVPSELERIVAKALRKDRDERYQTIRDMLLDLQSLKQELEFERKLERSVPRKSLNVSDTAGATMEESFASSTDTEAYQLYLQGRYQWNKRTKESLKHAVEYFQQAIEKDPNYALAYSSLADCYTVFSTYDLAPPTEAYTKARLAAQKALEIDPTLGEAYATLADVKESFDWDFEGSERTYQKALALAPNYATAHQWYGELLRKIGRIDEALAEQRRAQELDPLSRVINTSIGQTLYYGRRYDEAIVELRKVIEMDANFATQYRTLGWCYAMKGMYNEAIAEHQKAVALSNNGDTELAALAYALAKSGQRSEAQKILAQFKERQKSEYVDHTSVAIVHFALGEKDEALANLEKAYQEKSSGIPLIKVNPAYDNEFRSNPRFQELLKKIGLP